jgi:hypothetical protein
MDSNPRILVGSTQDMEKEEDIIQQAHGDLEKEKKEEEMKPGTKNNGHNFP